MSRLAVDIGSEFVDVAIALPAGGSVHKEPTRGRGDAEAMLAAIDAALARWSTPLGTLSEIRVGSTGAVNMLLARNGARVALLATQGFRDCLWLGRQNRADLYDPVARSPAPTFLVDRRDAFEVAGRIDPAGNEIVALDEAAVRTAAARMRARDVEAVAVCLLFAHVDPRHETRCRDIIRASMPKVEICLSHEVDPQPREYERTVSTCLEAWLRPAAAVAMASFELGLRRRGFSGSLFFSDARGTLIDRQAAQPRLSRLLAGGPAASARCAAIVASRIGAPTAIAVDIGSTSTDIMLVRHEEPLTARNLVLAGVPLRQDMIDLASLAVGGGSRVAPDGHGGLSFGANSAEAPTLSDALVLLGHIPAGSARGPEAPLGALATALGETDTLVVAQRVVEAAERTVAGAVLDFAVRRNVDPAMASLVAMGGLGGILGSGIAATLAITRIGLPEAPAAAGALGLLVSQPRFEAREAVGAWTDRLDEAELRALCDRLSRLARDAARAMPADGTPTPLVTLDMASNPHMHPLRIRLRGIPKDPGAIAEAFQAHHLAEFGVRPPGGGFIFALGMSFGGAEPDGPVRLAAAPMASTSGTATRVTTSAGVILAPDGWSLSGGDGCFVLEASR